MFNKILEHFSLLAQKIVRQPNFSDPNFSMRLPNKKLMNFRNFLEVLVLVFFMVFLWGMIVAGIGLSNRHATAILCPLFFYCLSLLAFIHMERERVWILINIKNTTAQDFSNK